MTVQEERPCSTRVSQETPKKQGECLSQASRRNEEGKVRDEAGLIWGGIDNVARLWDKGCSLVVQYLALGRFRARD